ncbi:MAG: hypothetical protein P8J32_08045 [bacterium]|nr:hypothetical protein [bacterium]
MLLTTKEQVLESLNAHFGEEMSHWDLTQRTIWTYQAIDGTGKYTTTTSIDYSIEGQVGKMVTKVPLSQLKSKHLNVWEAFNQKWGAEAMAGDDSTIAVYVKESTFRNKPQVMAKAVRKIGNAYHVLVFWTFLYDSFLGSMDLMRGNYSYNKAVELSGIENPTDVEVARTMSTTSYIGEKDIPDTFLKEIKLDANIILKEGTVDIEGVFTINGEEANPLRWMWFIDPAEGALGTASRGKAAGEYVGGKRKFTIGSDFRNRDTFIIMNSKDVRVRGYAHYKEDDGELKLARVDKTVDMTESLPIYDYYGIQEMKFEAGE